MGKLKFPHAAIVSAGEGSFFMTEEFGLDQCLGEGRTVHGQEGFVFSGALGMDDSGDQFFAGATFTSDEDGHIAGSDHFNILEEVLHHVRDTDEIEGVVFLHFLIEQVFFLQALFFLLPFSDRLSSCGQIFQNFLTELLIIKGFGEIFGGSGFDELHGNFLTPPSRNHDHGSIGREVFYFLEHFQSVHIGKHVIK